jgi:Domain of unknown function (DUF4062)
VKIFVSSVVGGLEQFRDAASKAAAVLGHEVKRSEDFPASAETPQQACLAGVRWADAVLLILGERYGEVQPSGISATHEEYREAKARCPVLAFVQREVDRDAPEEAFVEEVRAWAGGALTGSFTSSDELTGVVTKALHNLEISRQAGPVDEGEMLERAGTFIPDRHGLLGAALCLVTTGGPRQQVLRPSEVGDPTLERDLHQGALLGEHAIFDTTEGVTPRIDSSAIELEQPRASLVIDALGTIRVIQPANDPSSSGLPVLIEEEVRDRLTRAVRLTAWALDRVDPVRRLSHVAPTVALLSAAYLGWRTKEEHARSPNSVQMPMNVGDRVVVELTPPVRPRAALTHEARELVDDFLALLRTIYLG